MDVDSETRDDIWILPLDLKDPDRPKPGQPQAFLRTSSRELFPAFSPDGRWIAHISDVSGRQDVYVRPADNGSATGPQWQIPTMGSGAFSPVWSRDGRELFFVALAASGPRLMAVDVAVRDSAFVSGTPRVWADVSTFRSPLGSIPFDVHPDGKRVAIFPAETTGAPSASGSVHVDVLLNFFDGLRRRVPVGK